jgi:hypothetical protein
MKLILSLALVVLLSACASGPYKPKAEPHNIETIGESVILLNKDLRRTLAVDQQPQAQRNANDLLRIQVPLRNSTNDEMLYIQVQTIFRNEAGMVLYNEMGSEAPWQTVTLMPNQSYYYTQQALSPEASKFVVRVRYLAPIKQ